MDVTSETLQLVAQLPVVVPGAHPWKTELDQQRNMYSALLNKLDNQLLSADMTKF